MAARILLVALVGLCALSTVSVASVAELRVARVALGNETAPSVAGNVTVPASTPVVLVECDNLTRINDCSGRLDCKWCPTNQTCSSAYVWNGTCEVGFCQGQSCDSYACTHTFFPCTKSIVGMLLSMAIYGVILAFGAKTISDGSELLLDLFPSAGTVIGALLLPVLGAVPDAAIVVASGLGSIEEAQEQLNVGVGTLAGSTIMLLTVPWAASTFIARCDLDSEGRAIDGKLTRGCSLTRTGVSVDKDTSTNARIMVGTALSYLIVQGVAFAYLQDPEGAAAKNMEHYFSLAGFIVCIILFLAYSVYQIMVPKLVEKRKEKASEVRRERSMMLHAFYYLKRTGFLEKVAAKPEAHTEAHARASALKLGRRWKRIATRRREAREAKKKQGSGVSEKTPLIQDDGDRPQEIDMPEVSEHGEQGAEIEEEEPFWKTLCWSIAYMVFGAGLVTIFSDPMVDVINDFASKEYGIGIPAFYVSFLITPYCSNASEVISSLIFAAKKRKANSSMTFSQLYGAATMNATFVLSIFFALITFRGLSWTFSAETVAILAVTLIVGAVASFKRSFAVWWAFPILSLYPLSLVLVYVLETYAHWK